MRLGHTKAGLLAATAAAALAASISAASAQTTTSALAGFNAADPMGSAAREVMRLVHEKCGTNGRKLFVGVASLPIEYQAFTRDQGNHIMNQVHGAFSRLPDVNLIPFRDVGAIEELRSVGMTQTGNAGDAERMIGQSDIIVRATGQRVGRSINFQLSATGRKDLECIVSTPVIELPAALVGEVYVPAEKIFDATAIELWRRSRGVNQIAVDAQSASGGPLDPHLPGYFTRQMSMAISRMEQFATENLGNKTELVVVPRREASLDRAQRWDADVVIEPRSTGYRLMIEARLPNTTTVNQYGLIMADELPSIRRSDLVRQASVIRAAPPPAARPGGPAANVRVARSAGDAAVISITNTPTRVQDTVDDQAGEQRYAFQLFRESFVEFDVVKIGNKQISFKPELFGGNGMPVDSFPPGRARINLRRYRLPPGQYELRVTPEERGRHEFVLATRAASVSSMLEFEPAGRLTRRFDDWFVGERAINNNRVCFAYTQARTAAVHLDRDQWRSQGAGDRAFHRRCDAVRGPRRREGELRGTGRNQAPAECRGRERHAPARDHERARRKGSRSRVGARLHARRFDPSRRQDGRRAAGAGPLLAVRLPQRHQRGGHRLRQARSGAGSGVAALKTVMRMPPALPTGPCGSSLPGKVRTTFSKIAIS
jgi:hypothetical protein